MTPPQIFDRQHMARNLRRRPGPHPDFVTQLLLDDLAARLATISHEFAKALILAPDIGVVPDELPGAEATVSFARIATLKEGAGAPADPENLALPDQDYDLIVSLFDLGITDNVPGFLDAVRAHLKPDGLFLAAFVGGQSLTELRAAWIEADSSHLGGAVARIAPFIDTRDAGGLLQRAGFALPVADIETHRVRYADPLQLMAEIKALGAANPLAQRGPGLVTPAHLGTAISAYQKAVSDPDGRVRASLDLIWLSGWAPHESQQKPLRPGSAKVNLADVLKPEPGNE